MFLKLFSSVKDPIGHFARHLSTQTSVSCEYPFLFYSIFIPHHSFEHMITPFVSLKSENFYGQSVSCSFVYYNLIKNCIFIIYGCAILSCITLHHTHFLYLCSKSQEIYKRIKKTFSSSEVLYRHALLPRLISTTRLNSHPQVVRTNNLMWAEVYSAHTQRVPKNEIDHL